ncbi:MAG: DUF1963 domain-containing protein [Clostridia bacterium]|nr:DUF1963 domain-containing protein [Clostridia bacterium]
MKIFSLDYPGKHISPKDKNTLLSFFAKMERNAVVLYPEPCDEQLPVGTSKEGGKPDVPPDFVWPTFEGEDAKGKRAIRPLSFLAQINLKEVKPFDTENLLPDTGLLSFFYEISTLRSGGEPEDDGCARVYYFPDDNLAPRDFPSELHPTYIIPLASLSFSAESSLPSYSEYVGESSITLPRYNETALEYGISVYIPYAKTHKLLGYGELYRSSILPDCVLAEKGLSFADTVCMTWMERAELEKREKDYILLSQFGSLSKACPFGNCGCIFFYILKEDLKNKRFDRVYFCLQNA